MQPASARNLASPVVPVDVVDEAAGVAAVEEPPRLHGAEAVAVRRESL
jgi:hypothetical protein